MTKSYSEFVTTFMDDKKVKVIKSEIKNKTKFYTDKKKCQTLTKILNDFFEDKMNKTAFLESFGKLVRSK